MKNLTHPMLLVLLALAANSRAQESLYPRIAYQTHRAAIAPPPPGTIAQTGELHVQTPRYTFHFDDASELAQEFAEQAERKNLERAKEYIEKIQWNTYNRLYDESANEMGDESDIDVEKESSPAQRVAEHLLRDSRWQGLFLQPVAQIQWHRANENWPVPYHHLKTYAWLWRRLDIHFIEGKSRLIGFPKFKKRPLTQVGKKFPAIGGDAGKGNFSAWTKNKEDIKSASFTIFYACRSHKECETILRRQFKKEVVITPITGYCDEGADFPYPALLRYYRLELGGHHLFLKLYAEPDGSPGMGEWGYTELEFYPKLDGGNLDDIKKECPLLPLIKKYPPVH